MPFFTITAVRGNVSHLQVCLFPDVLEGTGKKGALCSTYKDLEPPGCPTNVSKQLAFGTFSTPIPLGRQRFAEVKLRWTQAWRRMNKKGKVEEGGKKRARKARILP